MGRGCDVRKTVRNVVFAFMMLFTLNHGILGATENKQPDDLLRQLRAAPPREKSAILNRIAGQYSRAIDGKTRLAYGVKALKYATRYQQGEEQVRAFAQIAQAYLALKDVKNARTFADKCLGLAEQRGNKGEIITALGVMWLVQVDVETPRFREAITICERITAICVEMGDVEGQALNVHLMGRFFFELGETAKALEIFRQALKLYQQAGNLARVIQLKTYIASLLARSGNSDEAWRYLREAEKEATINHLDEVTCRVYNSMGRLFAKQKSPAQAVEYFQKGIDLATKINDGFWRATNCEELAKLYREQNEQDRALAFFESALEFDWRTIDEGEENAVNLQLEIAAIHIERKSYPMAVASAKKALSTALTLKNKVPELQSRLCLARVHQLTGEYRKSRADLVRSLNIASAMKDQSVLTEIYKQMADLYSKWDKPKLSQKYLHLARQNERSEGS